MATAVADEQLSKEKDASKQDILAKVTALENRIAVLEKERNSRLLSKRSELRGVFGALEEVELKSASERKNEKQVLRQSIVRIQSSVASFQGMLVNMRPGPTYVEALKCAMEEIETSVSAFKERQRSIYEQLIQEEKVVSIELGTFEKKLDSWVSVTKPPPTQPTTSAPTSTQSSIPLAILAFESFLAQTGGREGGWEDLDHQTFVRVRTKFNGHPSYLETAASELPTKSLEEVREHDRWYSEFLALLESKRKAIEEWKKSKETVKLVTQSQSGDDQLKRRTKEKEERLFREREERLKKLNEWKTEQALKRRLEEEEKERKESEQCRQAQREQRRREMLKAQVDKYVHEKKLVKLADEAKREEERQEEAERRQTATREVERFRQRDSRVLEAHREKVRRRKEVAEQRARALERTKEAVKVSRDPERLFRLTAGWEERKKAGVGGSGGMMTSLPRRAVPAWRQGL